MFTKKSLTRGIGIALACAASVASAAPVASGVFAMRTQNSANDNNFATGDVLFWGANSVQPAATSYGVTRQCPIGVTCTPSSGTVQQALFWRPYDLRPDQYYASRPYDSTLTGPWQLVLSPTPSFSPATNVVVPTQAVGGVDLMPFVQSMSVQGAGLTPTISWQLPASTGNVTIDEVRVRVFDRDNPVTVTNRNGVSSQSFLQSDFIYDGVVPSGQTSFQLPASVGLQYGHQYSIAITLQDMRADGTAQSRSQSFFDFTPLNTGNLNVFLPTFVPVPTTSGLTAGPLYGFNISNVSSNSVTYIDPLVAEGYTYTTGAGDPNFRSVQIVSNVGDGQYDIYVWDPGSSSWLLIKTGLATNEFFDFGSNGVDRFQVRGIETSAGLNPFDITAFVTGLTFIADGNFTGTMQAIIVDTSIPEPATLLLLAAGLCGLVIRRRRAAA
ncbi:MAG: PEP-CTERM sorting domain-containing protein [Burkholderiales bacterium]|nr:PEP-CTERM sorting domain-containing protein [Burkholderiales bacterium]